MYRDKEPNLHQHLYGIMPLCNCQYKIQDRFVTLKP